MAGAAHCSLQVKRLLLDPKFEGYKLSLEPLACYQLGLDAAVAEVKLRDDQYTLDHMRAFGMYNYLHLDSWYQDNVYYVDQFGRVMNLSVTLIVFNEELGSPFIIAHSVSFVKSDMHSVAVLLLRVEKDELDTKGSGFHITLEWVTIAEISKEDPLYYWQQTEDDVTVTVHIPQDITKDDIKNPNPEKENPPCNAQELEECDAFLEDSASLCRFDGDTLKVTHVINLGSNQYLFSVVVDPREMPCFCLRHDVDALLWQPHSDQPENMWEHIATFNALGYVQASKQDKKFMACAPDYSYAALCECLRRVFIYRQPTPLSTVLYNRKEGRQVGQVAKQLVTTLEASDPILGFQATSERLFVLTTKTLFLIKVNSGN
ncbi:hypothetical protein llap_93 [Limosa lapponica baueri]|uniref:NudC domain-containing protein 1 n=1 Tax=Limosa lapponica baueri TaxID=1758121 RepID=A0A2I0UU27_LIMLA|nr:hypothetical protein llap_93 [Limosa lapponica baueri]